MPSFGDWGVVRYPRLAAGASRAVCLFLGVTIHWGDDALRGDALRGDALRRRKQRVGRRDAVI
jgi:hypothetical protein